MQVEEEVDLQLKDAQKRVEAIQKVCFHFQFSPQENFWLHVGVANHCHMRPLFTLC